MAFFVNQVLGVLIAGWSKTRVARVLYPFGAAAMAVSVFFASLVFSWVGERGQSAAWSIGPGWMRQMPALTGLGG